MAIILGMITPETIKKLRDGLLALHSALLTYQKHEYEQNNATIQSPAQYFQLVTSHTDFAWLRALSELIVGLDELCDHPEQATEQKVHDMFAYAKTLLNPADVGNEFAQKYQRALQVSPAVALEHGKVIQVVTEK